MVHGVTSIGASHLSSYPKNYFPCTRWLFAVNPLGTRLRVMITSGLIRWRYRWTPSWNVGVKRGSREQIQDTAWVWKMNLLMRDRTTESVMRDQILRRERRQPKLLTTSNIGNNTRMMRNLLDMMANRHLCTSQ